MEKLAQKCCIRFVYSHSNLNLQLTSSQNLSLIFIEDYGHNSMSCNLRPVLGPQYAS